MPSIIHDYGPSKKSPWKLIGTEALAIVANSLLLPFGTRPSSLRMPRKKEQRTIVFVHGYFANRSSFFVLGTYLRTRGVSQTLNFNYRPQDGVEKSARALKKYLKRHAPGGRIDLVCHSLGGLVAQVYIQDLGGARRVDRCVTLGTPHRGTYNAYWLNSKVGRELRPDSALMKRLQSSRKKATPVQFTSVVAASDNIVIPRIFAASKKTIRIPDIGHLGLMLSLTTFRIVADVILKPVRRSSSR